MFPFSIFKRRRTEYDDEQNGCADEDCEGRENNAAPPVPIVECAIRKGAYPDRDDRQTDQRQSDARAAISCGPGP